MKNRANWLMIPAAALSFVACDNTKEESGNPKPSQVVEEPAAPAAIAPPAAAEPPPSAPTPAISPQERAAKLGFVKHLPQETEVVMAFHNGTKSAERIQSSKLWKLIETEIGAGAMIPGGEEMDEELPLPEGEQDQDTAAAEDQPAAAPEEEPMGPSTLFGSEFTVALGKSAGLQTSHLFTLNRRSTYFQMRNLAKALVASAKSGDPAEFQAAMGSQLGEEFFKDLLTDKESGIDLFKKMKMPPLYMAFRTTAAQRDAAAQQLASLTENLGMLGEEIVESIEVEKVGQKFEGKKISGAKIAEGMKADRAEMDSMLGSAAADQWLDALSGKDLVVLSGTIGDYVLLFIGSSADDLVLAQDLDHSMVANDSLKFTDAYASKELAAVIHGEKSALDSLIAAAGGLADMAAGIRDGLAGSEGLGDTRDIETLLRMVGERESALLRFASNDTLGLVAFFEEGLKLESFGGSDRGAIDWKTPNRLASLGASDDVAMFANMTVDAAYDEAARAYMEALLETSYAMAMKVTELPMENAQMTQFKDMAKLFDEKFRGDTVALWDAFNGDFGKGLGNESAWVIDLNGAMPAIPGVPQPVVDKAAFPRISMVSPVSDRSKLSGAWEKMNASATGVLAKVSELTGSDIPMQKPVSSEKDGYTTWFFPLPFFNDDFMPSVTVGDQWFAASTSKNRALDLLDQAAKGGETSTGLNIKVNFQAMRKFVEETRKVIAENKDALPVDEPTLANFDKLAKAMEDLDKLTIHSRRESGVLRTSIHFKTR